MKTIKYIDLDKHPEIKFDYTREIPNFDPYGQRLICEVADKTINDEAKVKLYRWELDNWKERGEIKEINVSLNIVEEFGYLDCRGVWDYISFFKAKYGLWFGVENNGKKPVMESNSILYQESRERGCRIVKKFYKHLSTEEEVEELKNWLSVHDKNI